jgi:dual specificity phosphatase 12
LEGRQRHLVDVEDSEDANLLQQLPAAVAFVCGALGWPLVGGGALREAPASTPGPATARVLIHCAQGVSRSAAVAAACLMARAAAAGGADLDPTKALAALRLGWPAAAPNPGFLQQLELFHAMGCRLLESYVPYKRFLLRQVAARWHSASSSLACRQRV